MSEKREEKNFEEVEKTLEEIRDEKRRGSEKKKLWKRILACVFFPFTLAWRGIKYVVARIKIPITAKCAHICAFVYARAGFDRYFHSFVGAELSRFNRRTIRGIYA